MTDATVKRAERLLIEVRNRRGMPTDSVLLIDHYFRTASVLAATGKEVGR